MNRTGEEAERFVADECERIGRLCWSQGDSQLILLRAHLLVEHYMERLLHLYLRRGDKVIDRHWKFAQKLVLIEGLDALSDKGCQAIRELNSVRNDMVHKMDYQIGSSNIDKIGRPFGKDFTEVRTRYADSPHDFLCATLNLIFREVCCAVFAREATGQARPAGE
jgi:hypothetical protein